MRQPASYTAHGGGPWPFVDIHPRGEHRLPLHVMAGAARDDRATLPMRVKASSVHVSGVQFG